jgi:hypothetical protein
MLRSTVEECDGGKSTAIMLQGWWEKTLSDYLREQYQLPDVCLDVQTSKGQGEKVAKKASNIHKR